MKRYPMTLRGAEALRNELKRLKCEDRPRVIKAIAEARSHGDLSENAEYHAAREQQGFIEGRIGEIEAKLSTAEIIDPSTRHQQRQGHFWRHGRARRPGRRQDHQLPDRWRGRGRHQGRPHFDHFADRACAGGQERGRCRRRRRAGRQAQLRNRQSQLRLNGFTGEGHEAIRVDWHARCLRRRRLCRMHRHGAGLDSVAGRQVARRLEGDRSGPNPGWSKTASSSRAASARICTTSARSASTTSATSNSRRGHDLAGREQRHLRAYEAAAAKAGRRPATSCRSSTPIRRPRR